MRMLRAFQTGSPIGCQETAKLMADSPVPHLQNDLGVDNIRIGLRIIITAFSFFLIAGIFALLGEAGWAKATATGERAAAADSS